MLFLCYQTANALLKSLTPYGGIFCYSRQNAPTYTEVRVQTASETRHAAFSKGNFEGSQTSICTAEEKENLPHGAYMSLCPEGIVLFYTDALAEPYFV